MLIKGIVAFMMKEFPASYGLNINTWWEVWNKYKLTSEQKFTEKKKHSIAECPQMCAWSCSENASVSPNLLPS